MRRLNIAFGLQRAIRALVIWRAVLTLLVLLWWDGQAWTYRGGATRERRAERQQQRAQWLTRQLLELGSAFIKLGQLLSSRPDILPAGWVSELASLQDNVPAFSFDHVQTVLEEELGQRCAEVIDHDPQPLGAASLAQVHRASLRSGRQVVLKVQRQGLDRRFRLDLDVMQQVAAVLQRHPSWGRGRDWPAMARECRRVLLRELDIRCSRRQQSEGPGAGASGFQKEVLAFFRAAQVGRVVPFSPGVGHGTREVDSVRALRPPNRYQPFFGGQLPRPRREGALRVGAQEVCSASDVALLSSRQAGWRGLPLRSGQLRSASRRGGARPRGERCS